MVENIEHRLDAVFLDRDGVLNELVFYEDSNEFSAPRKPADLRIFPWTVATLQTIRSRVGRLFVVSNQPGYAKGQVTLEEQNAVEQQFETTLRAAGVRLDAYFYCHHHPAAVVPELRYRCDCRKPEPGLVCSAIAQYRLDPSRCWMIGDQDSDIQCGKRAGLTTVLLNTPESAAKRQFHDADHVFRTLADVVPTILRATSRP